MTQTPAGWYPDPWNPERPRWWDGTRWTEHVEPPAAPPSPGPGRVRLAVAVAVVLAVAVGAVLATTGGGGPRTVSVEEWASSFCGRVIGPLEHSAEVTEAYTGRHAALDEVTQELLDDSVEVMRASAALLGSIPEAFEVSGTPDLDDLAAFERERDVAVDIARSLVDDIEATAREMETLEPGDDAAFTRLSRDFQATTAEASAISGPEDPALIRALDDEPGCEKVQGLVGT